MDDDAFAAIYAADARLYNSADGNELIDPLGGRKVPAPQKRQHRLQPGVEKSADPFLIAVLVIKPQKSGGGQAVADVQGLTPVLLRPHAVAKAALVAQNQIESAQIG